jgi:hypothetical protein
MPKNEKASRRDSRGLQLSGRVVGPANRRNPDTTVTQRPTQAAPRLSADQTVLLDYASDFGHHRPCELAGCWTKALRGLAATGLIEMTPLTGRRRVWWSVVLTNRGRQVLRSCGNEPCYIDADEVVS